MGDVGRTLVILGALFFVGLGADRLARRLRIPRVTVLMVVGVVIGPAGFGLVADSERTWFPFLSHIALAMVGFLLGNSFERRKLRSHGSAVLAFSVGAVSATAILVAGGLVLLGTPWPVALVLGGVATATDPAASQDVVRESGADGPFTRTLLGVVALDDVVGLLAFSVLLNFAQWAGGAEGLGSLVLTLRDIGGAILLGASVGLPMAYMTGRVSPGDPTLAEALGGVLLCSGLALWLDVSFLLACMTQGAVVANLARHHIRPFHAIEGIEWPFMMLFFLLAGASLRVDALVGLGALVPAYVVLRSLGRVAGGWIGGHAVGWPAPRRGWMGVALMPQAGVAIGMALVASEALPGVGDPIVPVAIASTVLFEFLGPVLTRRALVQVGEVASPRRG